MFAQINGHRDATRGAVRMGKKCKRVTIPTIRFVVKKAGDTGNRGEARLRETADFTVGATSFLQILANAPALGKRLEFGGRAQIRQKGLNVLGRRYTSQDFKKGAVLHGFAVLFHHIMTVAQNE